MTQPDDLDNPIPASVANLLEQVYRDADAVAPARSHEFAVNVLLNALQSVLEAVRNESSEHHDAYLRMILLMLKED